MSRPLLIRIPWSHYVAKAEWGLSHRGIEYDCLDIGLAGMIKWQAVLPEGTVPVLETTERLVAGSDDILRWANSQGSGPDLYPSQAVSDWEKWADEEIGPVVRREAYRWLYNDPAHVRLPSIYKLAVKLGKKQILGVLKFYKVRRFDESDEQAVPEIIARITAQLNAKETPYLFGETVTAADIATAALFRPMRIITNHPAMGDEWNQVMAFIDRVKPKSLTRGKKRWANRLDLKKRA